MEEMIDLCQKKWEAIHHMTIPSMITLEDCQVLYDMGSYPVIHDGVVKYFTSENIETEKKMREWEL